MKFSPSMSVIGLTLLFAACGNNDNAPLELAEPKVAIEPLRNVVSSEEVERYLKNGMKWHIENPYAYFDDTGSIDDGAELFDPAPDSAADGGGETFSDTYTIEAGVDEADSLKFDGQYIYTLNRSDYSITNNTQPKVNIFRSDPETDSASKVAEITIDTELTLTGMYALKNDDLTQLAVISGDKQYYWQPWIWSDWHYWQNNTIGLQLFQVDAQANATQQLSIEIQGQLLSSRRVDDMIYLVSQFSPSYELNSSIDPSDEQAIAEAQAAIDNIPLTDLLPKITINNQQSDLIDINRCALPESTTQADGNTTILSITSINLATGAFNSNSCTLAKTYGLAMSTDNLILVGSSDNQSVFHQYKFADDGSARYQRSAIADGRISGNPIYFINQQNDILRVLTSKDAGLDHQLSIFKEVPNSDAFDLLSTLPNEARPEPIGKPNEQIFAVRFFGDRAYVVTFEIIDPFYVLELSDPSDPYIAGELEIPGFSTFLHPVNDDYVLGLGQEQAWGNVKVELYDVSDISNPSVHSNIVFSSGEGNYSPALDDHHAFTLYQPNNDQVRFALPISNQYLWWADDSGLFNDALQLFEINGLSSGNVEMTNTGQLQLNLEQTSPLSYYSRAMVNQDVVHFWNDSDLFSANWNTPEAVSVAE